MRLISQRYGILAVVLGLLCVCSGVRAQEPEQTRVSNVVYGQHNGTDLTMDVFKPAKPNGIAVLWMVSGGWVSSRDAINPDLAKLFTSRGDTFFEIVHTTQPQATIDVIVPEIQRAVRFIRFHASDYGIDPNKIGISGASSGGHLSLMTGAFGGPGIKGAKDPVDRASDAVEAVACFFPPTDFLNYGATGVDALEQHVDILKPYAPAFGVVDATSITDRKKIARADSPIYGVTKKMPPTLIIHGDADPLVPIQQSQLFMAKLDTLHVPHQLVVRPGKGHGWADMGTDVPLLADWFDKYLPAK